MSEAKFTLTTEMRANMAQFRKGMSEARSHSKRTAQGMKGDFANLSKAVSGAVGGFASLLPALSVAGAAVATFRGAINTTQEAGDKWAVTVATANGALEGWYRTVATGDWSNLFDNMIKSSDAAKQLAKDMDALFEIGLSAGVKNSKIELQIAELETALKVAKANKEYGKVVEIADKINALSLEKLNNQMKVAQNTRDAFFREIQQITGLSNTELVGFIETFNDSEVEKIRSIAEAYNEQLAAIEPKRRALLNSGMGAEKADYYIKLETKKLEEGYDNNVKIYAATLRAYNRTNDEKIKAAIEAEQQIYNVHTQYLKQKEANETAKAKALRREDDLGNKEPAPVKTPIQVELIGLPKLKAELQELQKLQAESASPEIYAQMGAKIDEVQLKIDAFTGKMVESNNEINNSVVEVATEGLPALMEQLRELQALQALSVNPEIYAEYGRQIDEVQSKIDAFTGKVVENTTSFNDSFSALANLTQTISNFSSTTDRANNTWLGFATTVLTMVPQMIAALTALGIVQSIQSKQAVAGNVMEAGTGAIASGSKMPFPLNIAAMAAGVAAVIAMIAALPKFETGGVVGGTSYTGDKILARVNSGELILNQSQQGNLAKLLEAPESNPKGQVKFIIEGNHLVGVLNNQGKRINSFK